MPKTASGQTSLHHYFLTVSPSSSQTSKNSQIRQTRKPRPKHDEHEERVEIKTKNDGKHKESRTEASSLKASREVVEIADYDASATRFEGKGKARQDGPFTRSASRSSKSSDVDTTPSTPTGTRRGLPIDLTTSPTPKRGSGNKHSLPTPPATGMKRSNVALSSPTHPEPPQTKRVRRASVTAEAPQNTPAPLHLPNAAPLPTPTTNRRPTRAVLQEPSSPLSSPPSTPQKDSSPAHCVPDPDPFLASSPLQNVVPLSPSRKLQLLPDVPLLASKDTDASLGPLSVDGFKIPALPSTPRRRRPSSDSVVESSQVEEWNPFCPETPMSERRRTGRLDTPIGSTSKDTVATSQSSEMEMRFPSSPAAAKKPPALRLETHSLPKAQSQHVGYGHQAPSPVAFVSPDEVVPTSQATLENELTSTPHLNRWPYTPPSKTGIARNSQLPSRDLTDDEISPDTPSHRGRQNQRSPKPSPRSHKRFSSPASGRRHDGPSRTPMKSLVSRPPSLVDEVGSTQRADAQFEGLFGSQEMDEHEISRVSFPFFRDGAILQHTSGSAHPGAGLEDVLLGADSSQTEPESSQHRVFTQGKPTRVESQIEPEFSPFVDHTQGRPKTPVESSQTQPESPGRRVPTQGKMSPVDESQTQPESLQWRVETQGPLRTPQKATPQRPSGTLAHDADSLSHSTKPVIAPTLEERKIWGGKAPVNPVMRRLEAAREHALADRADADGSGNSQRDDEPIPIPSSDFDPSQSQSQSQSQFLYSSNMPTQVREFFEMFPSSMSYPAIPHSPSP